MKDLNDQVKVVSFTLKPAYTDQKMSGVSLKGPSDFMKSAKEFVAGELLKIS